MGGSIIATPSIGDQKLQNRLSSSPEIPLASHRSGDERFLNQFKSGDLKARFKPYSKYPMCYKVSKSPVCYKFRAAETAWQMEGLEMTAEALFIIIDLMSLTFYVMMHRIWPFGQALSFQKTTCVNWWE